MLSVLLNHSSPDYLSQGLSRTWSLPFQLVRLSIKPLGSGCLLALAPVLELWKHTTMPGFWESEPTSLCFMQQMLLPTEPFPQPKICEFKLTVLGNSKRKRIHLFRLPFIYTLQTNDKLLRNRHNHCYFQSNNRSERLTSTQTSLHGKT